MDKLMLDLVVVATDPSKPKTRAAVKEYLKVNRKDPVKLEVFLKKRVENKDVSNLIWNPITKPINSLIWYPINNPIKNPSNNAKTKLKKQQASAEWWSQHATDGDVRPHEEVHLFHSVLLRDMLLLTAKLLCSCRRLCIRISLQNLSMES
jgi:hypothetical protein